MANALLALTGFLIMYGSLYPFNFTAAPPDVWQQALTDLKLFTGRGDVLGNVGLFVPWGIAGIAVWAPRSSHQKALVKTLVWGFVVAVVAQIGQAWVPSRDPAVGDVLWNMVGCVTGVAISVPVLRRLSAGQLSTERMVAAALLAAWVVGEWLPLVPSLDLQLLKDKLKELISPSDFSLRELVLRAALALLVGQLLTELQFFKSRAQGILGLALLCGAVMAGKFFIQGSHVEFASMLGLAVGVVGWAVLSGMPERQRRQAVSIALFLAYSIASLAPFTLAQVPGDMRWIPFAAMLEGSMLANVGALVANLVLFGGMLHMAQLGGSKPMTISVLLAVWVLVMESAQIFISTRTADITEVLLVLALGQVLALVPIKRKETAAAVRHSGHRAHGGPREATAQRDARTATTASAPASASAPLSAPSATSSWRKSLIATAVLVALIVLAMSAVLRLPGIPYNVVDMFRADASPLAIACFALAVVSIGAGPVWLARWLRRARHPALLFPFAALAVCLVTLTFLWSGVTTESIEDIAGSANINWFVINKDIWGETMRKVFITLDAPGSISFLEYCVRFSALYAPLPIFLALMMVLRPPRHKKGLPVGRQLAIVLAAGLTLWLCKGIAFDWSSTDNLNELIEPDGEMGWGGGGYLYLLVALMCGNAVALGSMGELRWGQRMAAVFTLVLSVPLSWWLLTHGLNDQIEKYGAVFSGPQFLLGPDRTHPLSTPELLMRWVGLFLAGIGAMAAGVWIGLQSPRPKLRQRMPSAPVTRA
ncbi:VanZ family protein [Variovorax sp. HJSM1_2]|uniref:VanZ family protein n=1 Tax=Variovorax sp. HJSM1_2 TaxID=3366263 RepID=UPI003BD49028